MCLKRTGDVFFDRIINGLKNGGDEAKSIEVFQKEVDALEQIVIGTGSLNIQKFSGYVTNEGACKIFYYTNQGKLTCTQSNNARDWRIAENY